MKRPQYVFRPQISIPDHRRAWTLLQQIPPNQRKDFLVRAILAEEQRDAFKQILREVIREELARGVVIQEPLKPTAEKEVPKQMNWTGVPKHKPVRWSKPMRRANRKP